MVLAAGLSSSRRSGPAGLAARDPVEDLVDDARSAGGCEKCEEGVISSGDEWSMTQDGPGRPEGLERRIRGLPCQRELVTCCEMNVLVAF